MFSLWSPWLGRVGRSGRRSGRSLPARRASWKPSLEALEDRSLLSSWSTVAPLHTARASLAAATGPDGLIYAIGGFNDRSGILNSVEAYNPSTNTWTAVASMSTARADLAAVTGPDGRIYAIGGVNYSGVVNTVEAYNTNTKRWTTLAGMPTAREGLAAATGPDGLIYAIGGAGGENRVEVYNPSTNSWTTAANLPTGRSGLVAVTGADGQIYTIGGEAIVTADLNTVEAYNTSTKSWSSLADMPTARSSLAAALGTDGRIYAIGGFTTSNLLNTTESYGSGSNSWSGEPSMPTTRYFLAAATGSDGRIYAIGGGSIASPLSTVEALSYATPVSKASATALSASANPSLHGQSITFTATVTPSQGSGTPTGSVLFSDGNTTLGSLPLDGNGQARFSTSVLGIGSHVITATYSGDSSFLASTSPAVTQTVNGTLQTWKGGAAGDPTSWSNAANWAAGVVPQAGDSVLLTNGAATGLTAVVDPAFGGVLTALTIDGSWNGTISVNRSLTISNGLSLASGSWRGDGAVTIAGSSQWTGGTITLGAGGWTNNGTLTVAASGSLNLLGHGTLLNPGTINQSGNTLFLQGDGSGPSTLDNQGTYNFTGDGGIDGSTGGGGVFINEATFTKTAGSGVSTVNAPFDNRGAVTARSGTLSLPSVVQISGGTLTGGTWNVFDPAALSLNGGAPLTANNGIVALTGPNAVFSNLTSLAANGGSLSFLNGASFSTAADFSNTGTLAIGVTSIFTVNGNYNQDPKATLAIQLGGTASTGQFGQLVVTATANLAGTLTITLVNNYVPQSGDSFTLLTFATRGTPPTAFTTVPSGFNLLYDDGKGTLTLVAP